MACDGRINKIYKKERLGVKKNRRSTGDFSNSSLGGREKDPGEGFLATSAFVHGATPSTLEPDAPNGRFLTSFPSSIIVNGLDGKSRDGISAALAEAHASFGAKG